MRQVLSIAIALIAIMQITSCNLESKSSIPKSLFETTWTFAITDSQNITAFSVLKYDTTKYHIVTTYTKEGKSLVNSVSGSYTYDSPNVTMVSGEEDKKAVVIGLIHKGKIYISESYYVFERQL